MKMTKILLIAVCMIFWMADAQAQSDAWMGAWQYHAPQADYRYQRGKIVFEMDGGEPSAFIEIGENKIPVQQLQVSEEKASFSITVEGQPVKVSLQRQEQKLTGAATYSGTGIPITAEKIA